MAFQQQALPGGAFSTLYGRSDSTLLTRGVIRRHVDCDPGYPARVSLIDARIGDTVLLLNYTHLDVAFVDIHNAKPGCLAAQAVSDG
ncbi:MAG: hypothetical protein AAGC71_15105 [Pseudomonadota bacterium]